jgi:acetyl esterase/lipase
VHGLRAGLVLLLLTLLTAYANGEATVNGNVSYSSVLELEYTAPDTRLVYGVENPVLQYGLLWLPDKPATGKKAPLVVFIHGGCWLNEYDIQHSNPLSASLAAAGYAVWSLEYRRTGDPGGGWPGSYDDIRQGIAFTSSLAEYPVDIDQIVLIGHSAGGHLALLAAPQFPQVDAVIGLAAISDIVAYSRGQNSCEAATAEFMGGAYKDLPEAYAAANPASASAHSNSILLQGDTDAIVPLQQSRLAGARAVVVEGAGHFDWLYPGTRAHETLLLTLEDWYTSE